MNSILSVTSAAATTRLTTLETVKDELAIASAEHDAILARKIDEATSDIEAHIGRVLRREQVSQTFWDCDAALKYLVLDRYPVASVTSITLDDEAEPSSEYRLDGDRGLLYRLDSSGYPSAWTWTKALVVVYVAGYLLPGETGRNLPPALESAAIDLVASYWLARGRDPLIKAEDVPGLGRIDYWVGAVGRAGDLPPGVMAKIAPFRRVMA